MEKYKKLKLCLNNLYGKAASSADKVPGYLTIGSVISNYAKNKPGFIYADTDSIHCNEVSYNSLFNKRKIH